MVRPGFWKCLSKFDYSMISHIILIIFIHLYQMIDRWYDAKDEEGVWRIGECFFEDKEGTKTIAFEGFHPNFTTIFCKHSNQVLPIRTKTYGLTLPEDRKPLRQVLTQLQIENISGRLNLYLMKPNYLEFEPKLIRSSIRTQFLILVDKIMTTPYEIIREIKMMDLEVSKFFINILTLYSRMIEFSKTYMSLIQTNQTAKQLYNSMYQLTIMASLIFGIHPHSAKLYEHKLNLNLKSMGFIDFFVMSQTGLMPFRNFFKGANNIKNPCDFDYQLSLVVANLFLDLCEKAKSFLAEGSNQSKTMLVLQEIITHLKHMADQNQALKTKMSKNLTFISKIQSLYFKFKPNKSCPLRKYLTKQEHKQQKIQQLPQQATSIKQKNVSDEQFLKMQERVKKLQILLANQQKTHTNKQQFKDNLVFERPSIPVQNLGEQIFLGSLQWALETGDIEIAKKLTKWRKSLLQIGRITGWEIALAVGARTYKKQQITAVDIIQANYEHLSNLGKKG